MAEKATEGTTASGIGSEPLVRVRGLTKTFEIGGFTTGKAKLHAVNGVDLEIGRGETLGLVGGERVRQINRGPMHTSTVAILKR